MKTITKIIAGIFLVATISSCNDKNILEPEPTSTSKTVGESYGGGTIFYVDASGQHGLIGAPDDIFWNIPHYENSTAGSSTFTFQVSGITGTVGTQLKSVNFNVSHPNVFNLSIALQAPNSSIINLVGGEPLMRQDLTEIISSVNKDLSTVILFTNGWFLEEKASELKKAGLDGVYISIDSSIENEHDRLRQRKGLFRKALAGLKKAKKIG